MQLPCGGYTHTGSPGGPGQGFLLCTHLRNRARLPGVRSRQPRSALLHLGSSSPDGSVCSFYTNNLPQYRGGHLASLPVLSPGLPCVFTSEKGQEKHFRNHQENGITKPQTLLQEDLRPSRTLVTHFRKCIKISSCQ